ncbi:membrane protein, partial [Klebsiella pneumoniae]
LDNGSGHIAPLFLAGCVIYGAIGSYCPLRAGVALFLLALGNWFGAETGYVSGWGAYWLGMNYPIRFVLFGGALLALCYGAQSLLRQRQLFTVSKAMGLT